MVLPKKVVTELIEKYEEYDIELYMNESYFVKKNFLLSKHFITHKEFQYFIEDTKGTKFTYFLYDRWLINSVLRHCIGNNSEKLVISDVKFREMCYIKFNQFSFETVNEVSRIIKKTDLRYLILDLRNNVGGNLQTCFDLLNILVPKGEILSIRNKTKEEFFYAIGDEKQFEKIYVLIGENTASCSEILSMVLRKKLDNVLLIGHKEKCKRYTQYAITNKLFGYSFSIAKGIWYVEGEDASCLRNYLIAKEEKWNDLNEYLQFVYWLQRKIKYKTNES